MKEEWEDGLRRLRVPGPLRERQIHLQVRRSAGLQCSRAVGAGSWGVIFVYLFNILGSFRLVAGRRERPWVLTWFGWIWKEKAVLG